ncbi:hypothetical protein F4779DRAFT_619645 [Xylariaceae sp. FL0662B]|nr:hypothetical protein F4779DRAFT_619645 [Xylariaceae sp. FL0662B]
MDSFTLFSKLPVELQLCIWDKALEDESDNRIVPFDYHERRVLPTASLVSPLLSTCALSRRAALSYFKTTLDIFSVPRAGSAGHFKNIIERTAAGEKVTNPSDFDDRKLVCKRRGRLYLNLARDVICQIERREFRKELQASRAVTQGEAPASCKVPLDHLSWALSREQCRQIMKVHLLMEWFDRQPPVADYGDYKAAPDRCFNAEDFPGTEQGCCQLVPPTTTRAQIYYDLSTLTSLAYKAKWAGKYVTVRFDHQLDPNQWKDPHKILAYFWGPKRKAAGVLQGTEVKSNGVLQGTRANAL